MKKSIGKLTAIVSVAAVMTAMSVTFIQAFSASALEDSGERDGITWIYDEEKGGFIFSGTCSEDGSVTWTYDQAEAVMTFSGTGVIDRAWDSSPTSWMTSYYSPQTIIFEDSITSIKDTTPILDGSFNWYPQYFGGHNSYPLPPDEISVYIGKDTNVSVKCGDSRLENRFVYYGYYGSPFYFSTPADQFIAIGTDENVPASGQGEGGANWNFDYAARILTIDGPGSVKVDEINRNFIKKADKIIIGKDLDVPITADDSVSNDFVSSIHASNRNIYCYQGSMFDLEFQKIRSNLLSCFPWMSDQYQDVNYLDEFDFLSGDINLDGKIDLTDAVILSKFVSGSVTTLTALQQQNADVNIDGTIDSGDSLILLRYLVHLENTLPCTD